MGGALDETRRRRRRRRAQRLSYRGALQRAPFTGRSGVQSKAPGQATYERGSARVADAGWRLVRLGVHELVPAGRVLASHEDELGLAPAQEDAAADLGLSGHGAHLHLGGAVPDQRLLQGLAQVDAPFTGPQRWMILTSRSGACATTSTLRPEEPKVSSR